MYINIYSKKPMMYINTVCYIYKPMHSGDSSKWYAVVRTNVHSVIIRHVCDKEKEKIITEFVLLLFFSLLPPLHSLLIIKKLDFFFSSLMFSLFPVLSTFLSNASTYERKNNSTSDGWVRRYLRWRHHRQQQHLFRIFILFRLYFICFFFL
jgi:hypothetical protein